MLICLAGCGNDVIIDVISNDTGKTQSTVADDAAAEASEQSEAADTADASDAASSGETDSSEPAADTADGAAPSGDVAQTNPAGLKTIAKEDVKVGVLYIGSASETSGYTYAHELGIQGMAANLGLAPEQVVRKENIDDGDEAAITKALDECIAEGCNIIFTTSWGYMEATAKYAEEYPDIYFAHGTGYMSNGKNFTNYFGRIYQARYLSGLVAGLKTQSNKIGYVSAMGSDNSECTGGIDAFSIGVAKVNPEAQVFVAVTNSWYDPEGEQKASGALIGQGCDVLAQHVDTTAPQTVSEANGTWSIGYNSDMSKETPNATLTSVIWNWSAYYTSYVSSIIYGTYDGSNYFGGMDESLIGLTGISDLCDPQTASIVEEEKQKIMTGEFGVFDGVIETNDGSTVGTEGTTLDDATISGGINWYYKNVQVINWNE
ncbi:MAG: BMP family ABC transporter substrate-binding protein [Lachnospiraceae bacterium]|nr:BMP family ABC transporter substrate-binding protein [Lachnospiraceae bacterium]